MNIKNGQTILSSFSVCILICKFLNVRSAYYFDPVPAMPTMPTMSTIPQLLYLPTVLYYLAKHGDDSLLELSAKLAGFVSAAQSRF